MSIRLYGSNVEEGKREVEVLEVKGRTASWRCEKVMRCVACDVEILWVHRNLWTVSHQWNHAVQSLAVESKDSEASTYHERLR